LLALLILLQWGTAEWHWLDMRWHFWFGYATLALLLFRLCWGFVGSDSARFSTFMRGPRAVLGYLRTVHRREPEFLAGHNPLRGCGSAACGWRSCWPRCARGRCGRSWFTRRADFVREQDGGWRLEGANPAIARGEGLDSRLASV